MGTSAGDPVADEIPWLRTLARRLGADDADDLVHETWMMAKRDAPIAADARGLRPWLATAMRNRFRSVQRSSTARLRREALAAVAPSDAATPERVVIERDLAQWLDDALATLSARDRAILRERFVAGRNAADIATALGVPAATVRTRLRRSLRSLRGVLEARHGQDRMRWTSAMLVLSTGKTGKGAITMASTKSVVVGVALVVALVAAWRGYGSDPAGPTAPHAEPSASSTHHGAEGGDAAATVRAGQTGSRDGRGQGRPEAGRREVATRSTQAQRLAVDDVSPAAPAPALGGDALAAATRQCATQATKHACDFLEPDPLVLQDMAVCGVVRYDFPAMFAQRDWTPEFEEEWFELVGATESERAAVIAAGDAYRDALFADLQAIAAEVGVQPWDPDATLLDVVIELSLAVGDDNVRAASRVVAQERAGQTDAPQSLDGRPAAERFLRLFAGVGDGFEDAVAGVVGPSRARELHLAQDGWPGIRTQTGAECPE